MKKVCWLLLFLVMVIIWWVGFIKVTTDIYSVGKSLWEDTGEY
jgi:hypothetical protein